MGYILIDEKQLEEAISLWNNSNYENQVRMDVNRARVDASHLLEVLQQEEKKINDNIRRLEAQRDNLSELMMYAESRL